MTKWMALRCDLPNDGKDYCEELVAEGVARKTVFLDGCDLHGGNLDTTPMGYLFKRKPQHLFSGMRRANITALGGGAIRVDKYLL